MTSFSDNVNQGVDIPTTDLAPETSINYEVGLKYDNERLRGQAYVYWTDLQGLTDRVLVGTDDGGTPGDPTDDVNFFQRRNIGDAEIRDPLEEMFDVGHERGLELVDKDRRRRVERRDDEKPRFDT